jgi:hypothetical protein
MEQFILLFEEYILKAIVLTENFLEKEFSQNVDFESFTTNRERLFSVIDQISRQIVWSEIKDEKRNEINRQIEYIKKLDEKLIVKLQEYQLEVKQDIESTARQKENIRGYNLSDVK